MTCGKMRLVVLVGVCVLFVGYDNGSVEAASFGLDSAQKIHATGSFLSAVGRRSSADFHAEDPNLCLSLREDEEQRQLLCNDRRSKFNYNPFGLRFGKRYNSFMLRRAVHRPRNTGFFPLELEVST